MLFKKWFLLILILLHVLWQHSACNLIPSHFHPGWKRSQKWAVVSFPSGYTAMVWWQLLYQSWYQTHKNSLLNDLRNDVMCGGKVLLRGKKTPTKTKQNFCCIVSGNMLYMFVHLGRLRSDEASNEVVNQTRKLSQTSKGISCKPETTSYTELKRDNSKGLSGTKQVTLTTSSLFSHSEKEVLVRSRAQQKNRNFSNEVKKGLDKAPAFLKTRLANCLTLPLSKPSAHGTEISFQYCYRANISTLVILGDMFSYHQQLDSLHLPHWASHHVVLRGRVQNKTLP